jgi:hypothetical protein
VFDLVVDSATQNAVYFDSKKADTFVRQLVADPVIEASKRVRIVESATRFIAQGNGKDDPGGKNIRERSRKNATLTG